MPKLDQLLIIDPPSELKFVGPLTSVVTTELCLKNPTDKDVMYKVRTTAPMKYCVRPNCGLLAPQEEVVISLSLQPFKHDLNEKTVDKFMVMSMTAPVGSTDTLENIWKNASPGQVSDTKLRCSFAITHSFEREEHSTLSSSLNATVPSSGDNFQQRQNKENGASFNSKSNVIPERFTELDKMKGEHKNLLDEGMKLRHVLHADQSKSSSAVATRKAQRCAMEIFGHIPPVFYLFLMFIVGFVIGKFVM